MDDFQAMPDDEAIATAVSSVLTLFGVQNLKLLQMLSLRLLDGTSSRMARDTCQNKNNRASG